jgi:hypothetical protein
MAKESHGPLGLCVGFWRTIYMHPIRHRLTSPQHALPGGASECVCFFLSLLLHTLANA